MFARPITYVVFKYLQNDLELLSVKQTCLNFFRYKFHDIISIFIIYRYYKNAIPPSSGWNPGVQVAQKGS